MKTIVRVALLSLLLTACAVAPPSWQRGNDSFRPVQLGVTTQADLLRLYGPPDDRTYLPLRDLTVWSYRYKESGVWDSMMHIMVDRQGVVRETMSGPDLEKEERGFFR
ncbi:hypothetical protein [Duganella sp. Root1480D1]|uniref:hypothetical protein n=1 Tax=Duganella sp. Root1480D1 TaxID=1736471 RepID=UPI000AF899C5|nr:hypothetical protein [Duganella sp. Root1480D1]